jgi:hypothetical protein
MFINLNKMLTRSKTKSLKFEEMKTQSLKLNVENYEDMPGLICGHHRCGKMVSFGGCKNYELNIFNKNDVCMCPEIKDR